MKLKTFYMCIVLTSLILGVNLQNTQLPPDLLASIFTTNSPPIQSSPKTPQKCPPGSECVPFYLCRNETVKIGGEDLIDIRIDNDENVPCESVLELCCNTEEQLPSTTASPPVRHNTIVVTPRSTMQDCGIRNRDGIGFKISGDTDGEVQFGEFPWMVAILANGIKDGVSRTVFKCGGSIINPSVVLTVAHCVAATDIHLIFARGGEWNTKATDEAIPHQDRNVSEIIVHNEFERDTSLNNIAIMFLQTPFDFQSTIQSVCLPPPTQTFDNVNCIATGWGKDAYGPSGKYHGILKSVGLPVVPHKKCEELLQKTRLSEYFELHDGFMCAGGIAGKDTCKGDGGSPLICPIPGKRDQYYQAGIVAWGIACNDANVPGVYMDVTKYRNWIDSNIQRHNFDVSSYTPN